MTRVVVIGAGVGGLTTAALLAAAGLDVTVLESEVYAGGCAGTFFHKKYQFDAGATLAAGFYSEGPMGLLAEQLDLAWPAVSTDTAMAVHLPDSDPMLIGTDRKEWAATRRILFGDSTEQFWRWQEETAEAVWNLALRLPPWPARSPNELGGLAAAALHEFTANPALLPSLAGDAFRPVAAHLPVDSRRLRLFVDAQLMISAQTTSRSACALYGAAALDMPRRGVVHLTGGMGSVAKTLAESVKSHAGRVLYKREATRVGAERGRVVAVETRRGESFPADIVVANLTPANAISLPGLERQRNGPASPPGPKAGWGAFIMYVGLDGAAVPEGFPLHHQVVMREPLGEGNSVFLSLSPDWDSGRAPAGKRAVTLSTHVDLRPWWTLAASDRSAYEEKRAEYADRVLAAAEVALPGFRGAAELSLSGTPVTFERFTRRRWGWVGGYPQTSLMRFQHPRLASSVWLVGDSIFPGQSTAAVALGGMRVARDILKELGLPAQS